MPLSFGNPMMLFGALAAAVPLVIHFLNRRRAQRMEFSDLRFLAAAETSQARSTGLRRLLLLLLRMLAILCVVAAVAQPRWGAAGAGGARSLLILLDAGASLQTQQEDGTRFDDALSTAAEMIAALPSGSEVQVLVGGATSRPLFASWLPAGAIASEALGTVRTHDGLWSPGAGLVEASEWVIRAANRPVDLLVISDFQAQAPDTTAMASAARALVGVGGVRLLWRRIGEEIPNGGVLALRPPRRALHRGEIMHLGADVLLARDDQQFFLELDGRRIAETVATGSAGETVAIDFVLTAPAPGRHRAVVHTVSDRLPVDDARRCVIEVRDGLSVLLVHGADRQETAGRGGWRFLAGALQASVQATGDPVRREDALFSLRTVDSEGFASGDLESAEVLVMVDPDPLGRTRLNDLRAWVESGGTAAFWLGDPDRAAWYGEVLLPALGLPAGARVRLSGETSWETATIETPGHALWSGLGEAPLATLTAVRWRRFMEINEGGTDVQLRLTEGAPLLLEGHLGNGRFVIWTADLDPEMNDFAVSPMFLPVVRRQTSRLAGVGSAVGIVAGGTPVAKLGAGWSEAGSMAEVELAEAALAMVGPDTEPETVVAEIAWRQGVPSINGQPAGRAGFYAFTADQDTVALVAVVAPAEESRPGLLDDSEIDGFFADLGLRGGTRIGDDAAGGFAVLLSGRDLAPWFLVLACLLLLAELRVGRSVGNARPC